MFLTNSTIFPRGTTNQKQALVWVNSRQPQVFPPNDVWETSAEIPYWWRVTTSASDWFNQIFCDTSSVGISSLVSQTPFCGETVSGVAKCDNLKKFETRAFYSFFTAPDRTTLNLCRPPAVGGLLGPERSWACKWPAKLGETVVRSLSDNQVRHPCCILRHSILWSKEQRYLECMTAY